MIKVPADVLRELDDLRARMDAEPELERQKEQWDKGKKDMEIQARALTIIDSLEGRRFSIDRLSRKFFDIFILYLTEAARKRGYRLLNPARYPSFIYQKEK